jgi:hypothetical protein
LKPAFLELLNNPGFGDKTSNNGEPKSNAGDAKVPLSMACVKPEPLHLVVYMHIPPV